jgi:phage-related protein
MSKEKKERRYSLLIRLLGASCIFLLIGSIFYIAVAGVSFMSGFIVAASIVGLVGPSVAVGEGFIEMITGVFELIVEGVQTIFEVIFDTISSIFG